MAAVDLLRQRLSSGICGKCATLVAGRHAPEQLLALITQQSQARVGSQQGLDHSTITQQSQSQAGASPALKEVEPALELMVNLTKMDWHGFLLIVADILILFTMSYVLRKAADLGLLDQQSDSQLSLHGLAVLMSVQSVQQPQDIQPQQEQQQQDDQQQQHQQDPLLAQDQVELPELQALLEVPYTAISSRLSRPWLVGHGAAPRSILQGSGDVRWSLGEGSFAKVYVACYHGQPVVVKELKGCDSSQQQHGLLRQVSSAEQAQRHREAVAALFKEAAMMEASRHSSVVQCLALCKEPPALVMEWCRGGSLSQPNDNFLASASALDIVRLLHNAAAAVAHLHSHQRRCGKALVHGDLRACNVMLQSQSGPDWGIKVADFGLAEWLQHSGKTEVQLVTNRCWVAPEVLEHQFGPFNISRASEVYMFGMLMYEALTGKWPYEDQLETLAESQPQRRQVLPFFGNLYEEFGTLQLPATLRFNPSPAVQNQLRDLYQRCASGKPQARPSMAEVVQQLDDIINLLVAEGG